MSTAEQVASDIIANNIDIDTALLGARVIHRAMAVAISMQKPDSQTADAIIYSVIGLTAAEAMKLAVLNGMDRQDFLDLCRDLWPQAEESIAELIQCEGTA